MLKHTGIFFFHKETYFLQRLYSKYIKANLHSESPFGCLLTVVLQQSPAGLGGIRGRYTEVPRVEDSTQGLQ
jgi:hypothetical protein